jgi:phosphoglycerate kinase
VPLDENFNVTDATRIEAAKPQLSLARRVRNFDVSLWETKGVEEKYSLKHILKTIRSSEYQLFCFRLYW